MPLSPLSRVTRKPASGAPLLMLLALLVAAAACGVARAQQGGQIDDTTGVTLPLMPSYTMGSNVAGYLGVSRDVCDYKAALDRLDWKEAKSIYLDGRHSRKADGSIRTLRSMATGSYIGEPFWDLYTKYFRTPAFIDDVVIKALDGAPPFVTDQQRREVAMKGVEANLQVAYIMHELDEAADKIRAGELSPASGAPHNVDEVVALYVGAAPDCAPWGVANRRAADFGTFATCAASEANAAMERALVAAQAAARAGNLRDFIAARARAQALFAVTYAQATLKYADAAGKDLAGGRPTDEHQAEGYAFFRTIEPLVDAANSTSAATLRRLLYPGNPVVPTVNDQATPALRAAYPGLGISGGDVGTLGAKQNIGCVNATSGGGAAGGIAGAGRVAAVAVGAAAAAVLMALV